MQVQGQGAAGGGIRQPPFESILFAPLIFAKVTSCQRATNVPALILTPPS